MMVMVRNHGMRGLGTDVTSTGLFSSVVDPATYLSGIVDQLNYNGGTDPATAQATLTEAIVNNYCTAGNPDCASPATLQNLINQAVAQVAAPGSTDYSGVQNTPLEVFTPITYSAPGVPNAPAGTNWTSPVYFNNALNTVAPQPLTVQPAQQTNALQAPSGSTGVTAGSVAATQNVSGNPVLATSGGGWFSDPTQDVIPSFPNWGLAAAAGVLLLFLTGRK